MVLLNTNSTTNSTAGSSTSGVAEVRGLYGKQLLGVQELLQKHTLSEADITAQRERARALEAQVQKFVEEKHPESAKIVQKSRELDAVCQRLQSLSATRLAQLKDPKYYKSQNTA